MTRRHLPQARPHRLRALVSGLGCGKAEEPSTQRAAAACLSQHETRLNFEACTQSSRQDGVLPLPGVTLTAHKYRPRMAPHPSLHPTQAHPPTTTIKTTTTTPTTATTTTATTTTTSQKQVHGGSIRKGRHACKGHDWFRIAPSCHFAPVQHQREIACPSLNVCSVHASHAALRMQMIRRFTKTIPFTLSEKKCIRA